MEKMIRLDFSIGFFFGLYILFLATNVFFFCNYYTFLQCMKLSSFHLGFYGNPSLSKLESKHCASNSPMRPSLTTHTYIDIDRTNEGKKIQTNRIFVCYSQSRKTCRLHRNK